MSIFKLACVIFTFFFLQSSWNCLDVSIFHVQHGTDLVNGISKNIYMPWDGYLMCIKTFVHERRGVCACSPHILWTKALENMQTVCVYHRLSPEMTPTSQSIMLIDCQVYVIRSILHAHIDSHRAWWPSVIFSSSLLIHMITVNIHIISNFTWSFWC